MGVGGWPFRVSSCDTRRWHERTPSGVQVAWCGKILSGASKSGTGHLERHARAHKLLRSQETARRQGDLGYAPDGQVRNFNYDPDESRRGLCHVIDAHDLPLGFGEYPAVVDWIRSCHNPQYQPVSRQTTSRDMENLATNAKRNKR